MFLSKRESNHTKFEHKNMLKPSLTSDETDIMRYLQKPMVIAFWVSTKRLPSNFKNNHFVDTVGGRNPAPPGMVKTL